MSSDDNLYKGFQEKPSRETLVDKLNKEIEFNLNNDQFGVDSLAQAVGMSRSSLHRKLHKLQGISTSQFIREYRLKRALEILKLDDITASEVAYQVGFSSATYFSTCFHKFYGYTPGEVKFRTTNEIEELNELSYLEKESALRADPKKSKSEKGSVQKSLFWATMSIIGVLCIGFFYYYATLKKSDETEGVDNIIVEKSIAVLPFKNLTGNPNLEYVSDGMTDAVISRLAQINSIDRVIPFTSILPYKETNKTIQQIATELGVEKLLQGNLQIAGDMIKINLQMIESQSNDHLWSEEYVREWKSDEIFKLQIEVVEGIAATMKADIAENELEHIQKIPTKNKRAYSYYLQAEFQRNKANELSYSNAIALYEKAFAIDPNFVEAYISMANIWIWGGAVWGIYNERTAWRNAKVLLQKALEIDPANREVEEELYTGYFFYDWNFELVEEYYQNILNDSFYDKTPTIKFDYAIKTGRSKEAFRAIEEHISIDPSNGVFFFFKAEALMHLDANGEAVKVLNSSDPLYSDNWFYLRESAKLYFYLGEYEKSKIQLEKALSQFSDYPPILMWLNAVYAQMEGDSKNTNKYLAELREEYDNGSSGSPAWFLAMYYCTQEDYEQTFDWLQKSYDQHELEITWLREEPLLTPIRKDPRYKDLYEKIGFSRIGLPIKTISKTQYPK